MQCMVVLSDGSYCSGVVSFCVLYGHSPLQNCYVSALCNIMPQVVYPACDLLSVELLSTKSKQESISFYCEPHICRNVKLFHQPQLLHGREVHSLLIGSNVIVRYFVY